MFLTFRQSKDLSIIEQNLPVAGASGGGGANLSKQTANLSIRYVLYDLCNQDCKH